MPGRRKSPDEQKRLAEILELAAAVDPTSRHARVRFMVEVGDLWVRGKTVPVLAKLWKLAPETLSNDANAAKAILAGSTREGMANVAIRTTLARLEERRDLAQKLAERLRELTKTKKPKPSEVRDLTQALTQLEQGIDRSLEWLGKVGGLTSEGPTVQVNIEGQPTKVRPEELASMPTQLLDALRRVVKQHPELAPVVPLLSEEIRKTLAPSTHEAQRLTE